MRIIFIFNMKKKYNEFRIKKIRYEKYKFQAQ